MWENQNPTADFSATTIIQDNLINEYKYLGFEYRVSTSDAKSIELIISVENFHKLATTNNSSDGTQYIALGSLYYSRTVQRGNVDNSIYIGNCSRLYPNYVANQNTNCIPTKITGYN